MMSGGRHTIDLARNVARRAAGVWRVLVRAVTVPTPLAQVRLPRSRGGGPTVALAACLLFFLSACGGAAAPPPTLPATRQAVETPVAATVTAAPVLSPTPTLTSTGPAPSASSTAQATVTRRPSDAKPTPIPLPTVQGLLALQTVDMDVIALPDPIVEYRQAVFVDARHGWIAAGTVIRATDDGGRTWHIRARLPRPVTHASFVSPQLGWAITEAGALATRDGGTSWQAVVGGAGWPARFQFVDAKHGWGWRQDDLRRTADGGATWLTVAHPCPTARYGTPFSFISPARGWVVCAGQPAAGNQLKELYTTGDSGASWQRLDGFLTSGYIRNLFFVDDAHGWATFGRLGLMTTDDGGRSWRKAPAMCCNEEPVSDVQFVSRTHGFIRYQRALLATEDGGRTWRRSYPDPTPTSALHFFDARHGIGMSTNYASVLLRTDDGGRTWHAVEQATISYDSTFATEQHGWSVVGGSRDHSLLRTTDGGRTWTRLPLPVPADRCVRVSFAPLSATVGYLAADCTHALDTGLAGRLFITRDGGDRFAEVTADPWTGQAIDFVDVATGWKLDRHQLYATSDGGRHWRPVPLGYHVAQFDLLPGGHAWVIAYDCRAPQPGATAPYGCPQVLLSTADGGQSWTAHRSTAAPFKDSLRLPLFVDALTGWYTALGYLYQTTDGGRTWQQRY